MNDLPRFESPAETYRRHARVHDDLARVYEDAANRNERHAAQSVDTQLIGDAHRRADRARESAEQSRSRADALRAAATRLRGKRAG
jgi:hypothetical protein